MSSRVLRSKIVAPIRYGLGSILIVSLWQKQIAEEYLKKLGFKIIINVDNIDGTALLLVTAPLRIVGKFNRENPSWLIQRKDAVI